MMIYGFWTIQRRFTAFTHNANYHIRPHCALLCMMQTQLSMKSGVSLLLMLVKAQQVLTWDVIRILWWWVRDQFHSSYDSPAYLGTLDSSMDQKQWSKANTCRGDSTGSVNTHVFYLSKHVQHNTTWSFLVVVLLLLWYKNRLIVSYCSMPPCRKSAGLSLSEWVRWSRTEYCSTVCTNPLLAALCFLIATRVKWIHKSGSALPRRNSSTLWPSSLRKQGRSCSRLAFCLQCRVLQDRFQQQRLLVSLSYLHELWMDSKQRGCSLGKSSSLICHEILLLLLSLYCVCNTHLMFPLTFPLSSFNISRELSLMNIAFYCIVWLS